MKPNIYEGTAGILMDTTKLELAISHYMVNSDEPLNYEVKENDTKVCIITGKNDIEKELPSWSHPLVFTNTRRQTVVAIDLRAYMKSNLTDMINIREYLQDVYNGTLQMYRLVFTKLMLDDDVSWISFVKNPMSEAFSAVISTTVGMALYDTTLTPQVDLICKLQIASLLAPEHIEFSELVMSLSPKDLAELTHGKNKELYALLVSKENAGLIELPSLSIGALVQNIQALTTTGRAKGLTPDIILQSLARSFFSLDSQALALAFTEDIPTIIAVLTMVINEGINAKSNMRKIINGKKRDINPNEFTKVVVKMYKDEIIEL